MSDAYSAATQLEDGETSARESFADRLTGLSDDQLRNLLDEILDRLPVEDLGSVIQAAQEKRRSKQDEAREALLRRFQKEASAMGLQVSLSPMHAPMASGSGARRTRRDSGSAVAAKFRGPNNEEWTGRGRLPKWLAALEAEGRNREEFRIR